MLKSSRSMLVLHLEPSALHAWWGGAGRRSTAIRHSESTWVAAWESALRPLDESLTKIISKLGVPPAAKCVVVFESPSAIGEVQTMSGSEHAAVSAIRLAVSERLSLSRDSKSVAIHALGSIGGKQKNDRRGAIVSAAPEAEVERLFTWIENAGLRCEGVIPAAAMLLQTTANTLSAMSAGEGQTSVLLHVDYQRSVLGVAGRNGPELLRTFEVGVNHLTEAIVRASQSPDRIRTGTLPFDRALECLRKCGIPGPDDVMDEAAGLTGENILPVMQPVIQRLCVEVKQSLRLGLRRSPPGAAHISMHGPGGEIPGLGPLLARSVDASLGTCDKACASLESWGVRGLKGGLWLVSEKEAEQRRQTGFRRAALVGAGIGIAALAAEGGWYLNADRELAQRQADVNEQLVAVREFRRLSGQAAELDARLTEARRVLSERLGAQPAWGAALSELSLKADGVVELTEIRGSNDDGQPTLLVSGVADAGWQAENLSSFLGSLKASPLFSNIEVVSRQLNELEDGRVYQFRLKVELAGLRPELMALESGQ